MTFDEWLEQRIAEIESKAREFAKARATKEHIDEFKKSKLAILMKKHEKNFPSAAAQEREARADQEYIELLDGLRAATEAAEYARWELELIKIRFEAWRTNQANQRAERGRYGA